MTARVPVSKRLVLINSVSSVLTRLLRLSVLVWLQQYLLKRISPEEYAIYPILAAVIMLLPLVKTMFTTGLGRYITEAYAKEDDQGVTEIVSTMCPVLVAVFLAILVGGGVFSWYVDHVLVIGSEPARIWDARIMMALMMFTFAFRLVMTPFTLGLYVRQRFVLSNAIEFGAQLLRIGILFVLLFGVSTRVMWVVVSMAAAAVCEVLAMVLFSRRLIPALKFRLSAIRWRKARTLMSFGAWTILGQLASFIRQSGQVLILNRFATPVDVNCFHLGSLADKHIRGTTMTASGTLVPALTAVHAAEDKPRLGRAYLLGGCYSLWVAMLVSVPLIVYSQDVMRLYLGTKYEVYAASATVMAILLCVHLLAYPYSMLPKIAYATGEVRPVATRRLAIELVNVGVVLYLVAVLKLGAVGCALGTLGVRVVGYPLLQWRLGLRIAGVSGARWVRETVVRGFTPAVAGAAVWFATRLAVTPNTWARMGVCYAAGLAAYLLVLFIFCLKRSERSQLRSVLKRFRGAASRRPSAVA